jgi:lipoprotein NlpI
MLIKVFPDYVLPYNSRGAAYYRKGEFDKAIADFNAAIRLKPDYGNAFWNRARAHGRNGELKQALADFDAAIRFKPKEPEIFVDRAKAREALKDISGAIADLGAAIELNPNIPLPYYQRGNVHFDSGDIDKAVADYDQAIRLAPAYPDPVTSRGRIELFHSNNPAAAAKDLATGVRLDPKDVYAAIWLHIARARTVTEDHAELAANAEKLGAGDWPWPVVQLFLGAATPDAVLKAAAAADNEQTRQEQMCEANFYLGMFRLEKKAPDEAKTLIAAAADKCPADMLEKSAAKAELVRLAR